MPHRSRYHPPSRPQVHYHKNTPARKSAADLTYSVAWCIMILFILAIGVSFYRTWRAQSARQSAS
ncbi:hypothetical protein ASPSYDRAFT_51500 [Aspergillus sydowii CBS 593.65]|uniref:Uncharacterized protein n=1 Tax=Aspergillus sydowii CBS 593.65 TaxID=1036612 RepID=A0A1L9T050_9EURO|nr:uncharacterized protein ASPSYDRAFT_51500 [Aspergillus sydowii CBS 593.65]OJJ52820.1 hypothetical protein ASPSYDRAFT_51500 [Aspergillus sydowii CBS 593.65]